MLGRHRARMMVMMVFRACVERKDLLTSLTVIYTVDIFYECVFPAAGSHEDPHVQPFGMVDVSF